MCECNQWCSVSVKQPWINKGKKIKIKNTNQSSVKIIKWSTCTRINVLSVHSCLNHISSRIIAGKKKLQLILLLWKALLVYWGDKIVRRASLKDWCFAWGTTNPPLWQRHGCQWHVWRSLRSKSENVQRLLSCVCMSRAYRRIEKACLSHLNKWLQCKVYCICYLMLESRGRGKGSATWQPDGRSCLTVLWSGPGDSMTFSLKEGGWRGSVKGGRRHRPCWRLCGCGRCVWGRAEGQQ